HRLRASARHPARRARRPRPPRAADQSRLRREEFADVNETERAGAPAGNRWPGRSRTGGSMTPHAQLPTAEPTTAGTTERLKSKDLLGIAGLDAGEITLILDTAEAMKEVGARTIK